MKFLFSQSFLASAAFACGVALASSPAFASLITTEEIVFEGSTQAIPGSSHVAREKVRRALTAFGVSRTAANERVQALSDAEVWQLSSGGRR
jgi:hypothetical protein